MPLKPGTPEFDAYNAAIAKGTGQIGSNGASTSQLPPGAPSYAPITPPNLSLNTSIAPPPEAQQFKAPTSNDARLGGLADEAASWQHGLAAGQDQDATLALQRQKDLQSGQRSALGDELALSSGFGGARNQKLAMLGAAQGRDAASLNADLTAGARAAQQGAFQTREGLEQGVANERLSRGSLELQGTTANNASNLNRWSQQQQATLAAQGLGLSAWQAAQSATAEQQRLAMQAQENNNANYWKAFQTNPASVTPYTTPQVAAPRPNVIPQSGGGVWGVTPR